MPISIKPMSGRPGHAVVAIEQEVLPVHFRFRIRRQSGDKRFVGADGRWHPSPQNLSPLDLRKKGAVFLFDLGPAVVNTVNEEELVVLEISDALLVFELVWPALPRSAVSSSLRDPFGISADSYALVDDPMLSPGGNSSESTTAEPERPATVVGGPVKATSSGRRRWRPWAVAATIGSLILIVAGASILYVGGDKGDQPSPAASGQPVYPDDSGRLSIEAKELIASRGDVGKLADLGQRLLESASQDAQRVGLAALFAASSRGSAVAQLSLGKAYDPRYLRPDSGPVREADAALAADRYAEASQSGLSVGGDELRGLCSWLRQRTLSDQGIPQTCANE